VIPKTANAPEEKLIQTIRDFAQQKNYRKALGEVTKLRFQYPEASELATLEADIFLAQGRDESSRGRYRQAIECYQRSLQAGGTAGLYYEISKAYLQQGNTSSALNLLQEAFETKKLSQSEAGCYLKVLFIAEVWEQVQEVLEKFPKRFSKSQIQWAKGVLHLHQGEPEAALKAFNTVKEAPTPGDSPLAWQIYTQQLLHQWQATEPHLLKNDRPQKSLPKPSLSKPSRSKSSQASLSKMGVLQGIPEAIRVKLLLSQVWQDPKHQNILNLFEPNTSIAEVWLIQLLRYWKKQNYHEAAHMLLKLEGLKNNPYSKSPEIQKVRRSLLLKGGQQAMNEQKTACACQIWNPLIQIKADFDPQLAYNYSCALDLEDRDDERVPVLRQLQQWIQKDAKQNPDRWPESYLKTTLSSLHCFIGDALVFSGKSHAGIHEVSLAVRLDPNCPEAWVRQGFIAMADKEDAKAIDLFTRGLEAGVHNEQAYRALLALLWDQPEELKRIKKQFAKDYGDVEFVQEVEFPEWIYLGMGESIQQSKRIVSDKREDIKKIPLGYGLLEVHSIFMDYINPDLTYKRASLDLENLEDLKGRWDTLLDKLPQEYRVKAIQLMFVYLTKFVSPQKGFAAVANSYLNKLKDLGTQDPEAEFAYIAMLAIKDVAKSTLDKVLKPYLNEISQPHKTLAELQLHVRYFTTTQALLPAIDKALGNDSQNPLLLLAKATTFTSTSADHDMLQKKSFELARNLQDQTALQRLREEEELCKQASFYQGRDPDLNKLLDLFLNRLSDFSEDELEDIEERLILFNELINGIGEDDDFDDDDDDDDDDEFRFEFPSFFPLPPLPPNRGRSQSKSRSSKGGFG